MHSEQKNNGGTFFLNNVYLVPIRGHKERRPVYYDPWSQCCGKINVCFNKDFKGHPALMTIVQCNYCTVVLRSNLELADEPRFEISNTPTILIL